MFLCRRCSRQEGPVAGEGGEGPTAEGQPAGGAQEEAGGAEAEGGETPRSAGGEAAAETGEEQGGKITAPQNEKLKLHLE